MKKLVRVPQIMFHGILHDEPSTTVSDVESGMELQRTTRVHDIGRLKEQALNLHVYTSMVIMKGE